MTGFTLTELLLALALSVILVSGMLQVFLASRQSYRTNEALARLQEDGRFAIQHLGAVIALARHDDPDTLIVVPSPGLSGTAGPDTLSVRYEGAGAGGAATVFDCLGSPLAAGEVATSVFSLDTEGLQCTTTRGGTTHSEVLVNDVADWRVLYGVDVNGDGLPNRYEGAETIGGAWAQVRAVRVSLLMASAEGTAPSPDMVSYPLLDRTVTAPGDRRLRAVFSTTVRIRNP